MEDERKLKVLEVEEKRSKDYILDDQSLSNSEKLSEDLKVWYKEYFGCCDSRWQLDTVGNLNLVPSDIVFKEFEDYPESKRINPYY